MTLPPWRSVIPDGPTMARLVYNEALRLHRLEGLLIWPPCVPRALFSALMRRRWALVRQHPVAYWRAIATIYTLPPVYHPGPDVRAYYRYLGICEELTR